MSDYIARDEVLALKQAITTDDSSGNEMLDVVAIEDVLEINPADVIERKKIDNAYKEIEGLYNTSLEECPLSEVAFRNGLKYAMGILKKSLDMKE